MYSQVQRVHALNVLRALYRTSSLGDAVQPFVSQGLKSAIKGYKSQVWARLVKGLWLCLWKLWHSVIIIDNGVPQLSPNIARVFWLQLSLIYSSISNIKQQRRRWLRCLTIFLISSISTYATIDIYIKNRGRVSFYQSCQRMSEYRMHTGVQGESGHYIIECEY